jgi:glyoxylase I family protein
MNITSIYHININCSNLERSLAFYKMLGFKEVVDFGEGTGPHMDAVKLPGARGRARLLQLGDDPRSCHIDLIEWLDPRTEGHPYEHLNNMGIARVCFYSKDIWKDYEDLKSKGIEFYTEPTVIKYRGGRSFIVCFEDPDGTVLELTQFQRNDAKQS